MAKRKSSGPVMKPRKSLTRSLKGTMGAGEKKGKHSGNPTKGGKIVGGNPWRSKRVRAFKQ